MGDDVEKKIEDFLIEEFEKLEELEDDRKNIGNPKKLVDSISQIVWEQFILQIAGNAGKEFIENNNNLNLSLKKADHYLNSENFVKGEMPTHNFENLDKYSDRYETWNKDMSNIKEARKDFDRYRDKGSAATAKDHTISVSEIIKDKEMATFVDRDEKIKFANDPNVNLKDLDSRANCSKGDKTMEEWLNSTRVGTDETPEQRFDIDGDELRKRDAFARKKEKELIDENKKIAKQEGRKSVLNEAKMSLGYASQAIAIALMAKLTRNIFQELIIWFTEKNVKTMTLIERIKKAIIEFLTDFKNNILMSLDIGITVILSQIFGEIIPMIRKALLFFKIGGKSTIDVIKYLNNPNNKTKQTSVKVMEVGKIVTVGLTGAGGIALGMAITTALIRYVPPLAIQIPLLGSVASIFGIFFGGLTAGICGAIVMRHIDDALEDKKYEEVVNDISETKDKIITLQDNQYNIYKNNLNDKIIDVSDTISENIDNMNKEMENAKQTLNVERESKNKDKFDELFKSLQTSNKRN